jgi:hypothetical protein
VGRARSLYLLLVLMGLTLSIRGKFANPIISEPYLNVYGLRRVRFDENLRTSGNVKDIEEKS